MGKAGNFVSRLFFKVVNGRRRSNLIKKLEVESGEIVSKDDYHAITYLYRALFVESE